MKQKQIMNILARDIRNFLTSEGIQIESLQEIRLRVGQPMILFYKGRERVQSLIVRENMIRETLDYVSNYSLYAYENEMRQGFITIEGGHRVGIAGQVILENGCVKNLKQISSLNIRISHEVLNCASVLFPYITHQSRLYHTMLISPPRCGKTTLLRDLIRQISNGNQWISGCTVGVVDERSELAGCYHGVPQNHMGMRTDVLDGCPKDVGMLMLIRSMSPEVVAVDELGTTGDIQAVKFAMHCGAKMLVTVHGESFAEIQKKPLFEQMVQEQYFERFVVLKNGRHIGEIAGIYNAQGRILYKEEAICIN